ncbi:MAG: GYD domain-containing protein [Acidobacteria bacterium]|nr:GYD domain-containing protein [Acidobacteriota bacterium]
MAIYIILSQLSEEAFRDSEQFKRLARKVSSKIKQECPGVIWKQSFATLGRYDVVDIIESDDLSQIEKAAMIIRAYGHARTETMQATPWDEFLNLL